jgi:hypothetical protein
MESETSKFTIWGEAHGDGYGESFMGQVDTMEEVNALPKRMYGTIRLTRVTQGPYNGPVVRVINKPTPPKGENNGSN